MLEQVKEYILNNLDKVKIEMIGEDGTKSLSIKELSIYLNGNIKALKEGGYIIQDEDDYYIYIK